MFKINDLVVTKKIDIVFIIKEINDSLVTLDGLIYRITVKEDISNLTLATKEQIEKENNILNKSYKTALRQNKVRTKRHAIFGTILHIDGDEKFLNSCLELYKSLNIHAWGVHLKEKEVKYHIDNLLSLLTPDIIVITGHDFYNGKDIKDLHNYENTSSFIEVLRKIRQRFNKDSVIIIAGACASNFEALIANGANFASSPKRINIHTYDPAVIAIKCATTSESQYVDFNNLLKFIENGRSAYGGIETKGKMKLLL